MRLASCKISFPLFFFINGEYLGGKSSKDEYLEQLESSKSLCKNINIFPRQQPSWCPLPARRTAPRQRQRRGRPESGTAAPGGQAGVGSTKTTAEKVYMRRKRRRGGGKEEAERRKRRGKVLITCVRGEGWGRQVT